MGTEIERKYLVKGDAWRAVSPVHTLQGYLNLDKERTVRVRIQDEKEGFLTIKGVTVGTKRLEYEYSIPAEHARAMLELCEGQLIEKNRYVIDANGLKWEVDEFLGDNTGLVVAEVELESEDVVVHKADWVGDEVSKDPRYFNSNLVAQPFNTW